MRCQKNRCKTDQEAMVRNNRGDWFYLCEYCGEPTEEVK